MANQTKTAMVHAILTLARLGWFLRRIAKELEIDRETVAWHIHSPPTEAKPATNPIPGTWPHLKDPPMPSNMPSMILSRTLSFEGSGGGGGSFVSHSTFLPLERQLSFRAS